MLLVLTIALLVLGAVQANPENNAREIGDIFGDPFMASYADRGFPGAGGAGGRGQLSLSITNSMEVLRQKLLRELLRRRQGGGDIHSTDDYLHTIG